MGNRYFYPQGDCVYSLEVYQVLDTKRILWSVLKAPKGGELEELANNGPGGVKSLVPIGLPKEVYDWVVDTLILAESK